MTTYHAECLECPWKSPRRKKEGKAEKDAQKHYEATVHRLEIVRTVKIKPRLVHER